MLVWQISIWQVKVQANNLKHHKICGLQLISVHVLMYSVTNALLVNNDKKWKIISFMFLYLSYMS